MNGPSAPRPWSDLRRDTAAYGIAIAVDRLSSFVVLPLLTTTMERSVFGGWTQVLTAFALLSIILEIGFYHSIVRYVPGAPRADVGRILHGMVAIIIGNSAIFILLAIVAPDAISQVLFAAAEAADIILAAAIFIVTECLFEFLVLAFLRADGQIRASAFYYVIKTLLRLALLWQGVASGADLAGLLVRLTLGNVAITAIAYAIHIAPNVDIAITGLRRGFWIDVIRHSGAIVLSSSLAWANASLNRFLIVHTLGLTAVGVYAANYSIASIVSLASLVINFTVIPHLNNWWNQGDKLHVRGILVTATEYYCYATIPAAVAVGVFYLPLARLLTSEQYLGGPILIWSLVIFMAMLGLEQLMTFATFLDNSRFSVRVRALSLAINVGLNLALLKEYGISASALAAALSTFLTLGFNVSFLHRIMGYKFPWRSVVVMVAAAAAMGGIAIVALRLLPAHTFGYAVVAGFISLPIYLGLESMWKGSVTRQLLSILGEMARRKV